MVLESTMVCVDNSDYMRNGDYVPTRFQAQQDAVNVLCRSKTRSNPENNVGLLTLANGEVLATFTTDVLRVLAKLHQVKPNGDIKFQTGIRIAHLALKHRQGKNHRMRIIAFVGSPVEDDEKELVKLAKRLKKEKVNVDIINFGEENTEKLSNFVNTVNGKEGGSSHFMNIPVGSMLSEALRTSVIITGEDGAGAIAGSGFDFGIDPSEDPELALALRVSMEEQRARQEEEAKRVTAASAAEAHRMEAVSETNEDALLRQALAMNQGGEESSTAPSTASTTARRYAPNDLVAMTEEEQIAYAMQMSLQYDAQESTMDTDTSSQRKKKKVPTATLR